MKPIGYLNQKLKDFAMWQEEGDLVEMEKIIEELAEDFPSTVKRLGLEYDQTKCAIAEAQEKRADDLMIYQTQNGSCFL